LAWGGANIRKDGAQLIRYGKQLKNRMRLKIRS